MHRKTKQTEYYAPPTHHADLLAHHQSEWSYTWHTTQSEYPMAQMADSQPSQTSHVESEQATSARVEKASIVSLLKKGSSDSLQDELSTREQPDTLEDLIPLIICIDNLLWERQRVRACSSHRSARSTASQTHTLLTNIKLLYGPHLTPEDLLPRRT